MASSIREFNIGLYLEHLDEASFLYAQRLRLLKDSEILWTELDGFESRLEAHIDALIVGGDLALQTCVEQLPAGEAGVLFAAVSVFCRHRRSDLLALALNKLDLAVPEQLAALTNALKFELPLDWVVFVERAIVAADARLADALASVAGYRRLPVAHVLLQALAGKPTRAVVAALGQQRSADAVVLLEACVAGNDPEMQSAALLSLLQIGSTDALKAQYLNARLEKWPRTLLALGGSSSATAVLTDIVLAGKARPECLLALGLLGDLAAMKILYQCLQIPECGQAAALALNWTTGANLYEEGFEAEEVNEDELFDNELPAWRERRQPPMRLDGTLFGKRVQQLSEDPETWKQWLSKNRGRFDEGLRYRSGQLYSPVTLLLGLQDPRSDRRLRRLAALELVIRYGCDVAFEPEMSVRQQLGALQDIEQWTTQNAARFQPGLWYVNGQPQ
jgi:HEAT repeat protein